MPRIKSLLANAHQFLLEPVVEQWPQQLLLHIDELVSGAPLGARSRVPETPFKRLSVVLNVLGEGAESIAFWDGDRMRCRYTAGPMVVACARASKAFTSHGARASTAPAGFCWMLHFLNASSFVKSATAKEVKSFWWLTTMKKPAPGPQQFGLPGKAWF